MLASWNAKKGTDKIVKLLFGLFIAKNLIGYRKSKGFLVDPKMEKNTWFLHQKCNKNPLKPLSL
jgi:hypothetical protein